MLALINDLADGGDFLKHLKFIIDGYNGIVSQLDAVADEIFLPIVELVNEKFETDLVIGDHWRPLFFLMLVFASGRVLDQIWKQRWQQIFSAAVWVGYLMLAAIVTSMVPTTTWHYQPLIGCLPFWFFYVWVLAFPYFTRRRRLVPVGKTLYDLSIGLMVGAGFSVVIVLFAVLLCLFEATRAVAGVAALGIFVFLYSLLSAATVFIPERIQYSSAESRARDFRQKKQLTYDGLRQLSGFVLAALILTTDVLIRLVS